jgi:thiol-disulfide isomerase/thioredoxin
MNMWWKNSIHLGCRIGLIIAVIGSVTARAEGWGPKTEVGNLEAFELVGDIPEMKGKVTLIDFWASWCAPCKAAFPEMEDLYLKHKDAGFQIVAISLDQKARMMDSFLNRQKPSFVIVHDSKQLLAKAAEIQVMPSSFLIDKKGVVRYAHKGWHGVKSVKSLNEQIKTLLDE